MDLAGKTAIVTGASKGIGRAFCDKLVASQATVYGFGRSVASLDAVAASLGSAFRGVVCDVGNEADVRAAVHAISQSGSIDILVNNAGIGLFANVDETSTDDWDSLFRTNVTGVFNCAKAVVPIMKAQNVSSGFGGHIVNIISVGGLLGNAGLSAYNATKFAIRGFTEALMKELRYDGIKLSGMYPGSVRTSFFDDIDGIDANDRMLNADDLADTLVHILETPDNNLISEIVIRPLRPRVQ